MICTVVGNDNNKIIFNADLTLPMDNEHDDYFELHSDKDDEIIFS